jgi:hypothetical protein
MIHDKMPVETFSLTTYWGKCSCGWRSGVGHTKEHAESMLQTHIDTHVPKDEQPSVSFS